LVGNPETVSGVQPKIALEERNLTRRAISPEKSSADSLDLQPWILLVISRFGMFDNPYSIRFTKETRQWHRDINAAG
jgi:hypothetical protein